MKCDELKSLKNIGLSFDTTTLHKQVIAEDSEGKCYGFDSWEEIYLKSDVDSVIDPCCGSGSTLLAAQKMSRKSFGFEVDRNFFNAAKDKVLASFEPDMFQMLKYENSIMNPPFAGSNK